MGAIPLWQEVFLACVSGQDNYGLEVDGILWEQQRVNIPPKIIHQYMESVDPEAVLGLAPPDAWVAEADQNARVHLEEKN